MGMHEKMMRQFINTLDDKESEEWSVTHTGQLKCKHGYTVEKDGQCPEGCVSILKQKGFI